MNIAHLGTTQDLEFESNSQHGLNTKFIVNLLIQGMLPHVAHWRMVHVGFLHMGDGTHVWYLGAPLGSHVVDHTLGCINGYTQVMPKSLERFVLFYDYITRALSSQCFIYCRISISWDIYCLFRYLSYCVSNYGTSLILVYTSSSLWCLENANSLKKPSCSSRLWLMRAAS